MLKLGSMRFILAIIVLLYHITKFVFIGEFAVICFFMLSGYWITFMYENKYKKFKSLKVFYISRIWRLFPVFLLFNVIAFVLSYFFNYPVFQIITSQTFLMQVLFWIANFLILGYNIIKPPILGTAWSLDVELQFYLVYLALILLFKKSNYPVLLISLIISAIISIFYHHGMLQKTLIYYLFFFLIGILIYLKDLQFNKKLEITGTLLFLVILNINYLFPGLRKITIGNHFTIYNIHLNEILPIFLIPLISNSLKNKSTKLDRTLGDMSFVLYLCHWVLIIPYDYFIEGANMVNRTPFTLGYIIVTLVMSYLIYEFYDKPIDNLRRKWGVSQPVIKHQEIFTG